MTGYIKHHLEHLTVSVGDSMFDERFGLARHKPARLRQMERHPNDALDAALCHGDLSIQFCANTPDTNIHALRDIIKNTPDLLVLHWKQEGTVPPIPAVPSGSGINVTPPWLNAAFSGSLPFGYCAFLHSHCEFTSGGQTLNCYYRREQFPCA